jgi:predicted NBD/HSP70 family sugar kinase
MPYFPQSDPDFNGLRHLLLLYGDASRPWTREQLRYSVAHVDTSGRADDWLFDSFLFLNIKATSGHDYCADVNLGTTMCGEGDFFAACSPQPGNRQDWEELLEFYFAPDGALLTLDETLASVAAEVGTPYGHRRNVVLMLPYPHITQPAWGHGPGSTVPLDFTVDRQNLMRATEQRLAACTWFLDEIAHRSAVQRYQHLHLLGVYWMFESVYRGWNVDDHWLLKTLRPRIHRFGLKFLWIPFWSTYNVHLLDDYRSYYFDLAFLQPNYMFYREGKSLAAAADAARRRGAGLEMEYYLELNEPIGVSGERHSRFRDYLNGGVTHGYMREAACAHFQGAGALERMHAHEDPVEREFYDDIFHFVKGDYALKPAIPRAGGHTAPAPAQAAIAVDLGGTQLRAAVVDGSGRVLARRAASTPRGRDAIVAAMVDLVAWAREEAVALGACPVGVGVSTGGRVDALRGIVVDSTALLEGWADVPVARLLGQATGLPVRVDNDGHCAALAERRFGAGRAIQHFVTVVVGTGVGGGVVCDGELVRGAANAAGELGHVSIDADGPACSCGNRGCVERYASGSGLAERARDLARAGQLRVEGADPGQISAEALGKAAVQGNLAARDLVRRGGDALGTALCSLVNLLNPQRVILAGPVLALGEDYLGPLRAAVARRAMRTARDGCDIVVSTLDEPALLGAAALVLGE